jgi:antibiotic biosynthesis monooxygenase (ABM) superfamily enzyme
VEADERNDAMSGPSEVVSIIRHEIRPGSEADYEAWTRDVVPIAQTFPGHQGVAVIRPAEGSRLYTVVLHFDTLEHLRGWLESDQRRILLDRIGPVLAHPGDVEIRPGLDFWLPAPGQRRARASRQFLIALSVICPLSLLVPALLAPVFSALPALDRLVVRAFIGSVVIVWLMTYVIMPRYTRLVAGWLFEEPRPARPEAPGQG